MIPHHFFSDYAWLLFTCLLCAAATYINYVMSIGLCHKLELPHCLEQDLMDHVQAIVPRSQSRVEVLHGSISEISIKVDNTYSQPKLKKIVEELAKTIPLKFGYRPRIDIATYDEASHYYHDPISSLTNGTTLRGMFLSIAIAIVLLLFEYELMDSAFQFIGSLMIFWASIRSPMNVFKASPKLLNIRETLVCQIINLHGFIMLTLGFLATLLTVDQ